MNHQISVAMMQRNEGELLKAWINHYMQITSADLITIIDNGSYENKTLDALKYGENLGIKVERKYSSPEDFERKGHIVYNALKVFSGKEIFLLPCDCDEFLVCEKNNLQVELERLKQTKDNGFRIDRYYNSIPYSEKYYITLAKKVIFFDILPRKFDIGFHLGGGEALSLKKTNLSFIHFHNQIFENILRSAREKLKLRVPNFEKDTLKSHKGKGGHLIKYFFMNNEEYMRQFDKYKTIDLENKLNVENINYARRLSCENNIDEDRRENEEQKLKISFNHAHHYNKIRMTPCEADLYFSHIIGVEKVLEFGMGGSTFFACNANVKHVGTVETDSQFMESAVENLNLSPFIESRILNIFMRNIGRTKLWGYPIVPPPVEVIRQFVEIPEEFRDSEIFFIDGRYRVACGASIYLNASNKNAKILIHDFDRRRAWYNALREIYTIEEVSGTLVRLKIKNNERDTAQKILDKYISDPR